MNPNALSVSSKRKLQVQYATGNITSQISDAVRARVAFNNSWNRNRGTVLPALNGTDVAGVNYGKTSTFPNYTVSGNVDWTVSPRLFLGVRGGWYHADQHDSNVTEQPFYRWTTTSNIGLLDVPANLQAASRSRVRSASSRPATTRCSTSGVAATAERRASRRPTCSCSAASGSRPRGRSRSA